jgi:hypothetical protein
LAKINYRNGFLEARLGKGHLIFCTFPQALANISLTQQDGYKFINYLLQAYPHEKLVFNPSSFEYNPSQYDPSFVPPTPYNPLRYILEQEAFKYSWYGMILMVVLYLSFNLKRRQRVMPLTNVPTNTSLEFIQTLGLLYFNNKDYHGIALKLRAFFVFYIKKHFKISGKLDDANIEQLSKITNVNKKELEEFINKLNALDGLSEISEHYLIYLHETIQRLTSK